MKVTFLLHSSAYLIRPGGAETQADQTAAALSRLGHEVEYFTPLSRSVGDVVHCFGSHPHYERIIGYCHSKGIPFLCSPIRFRGGTPFQRLKMRMGARMGNDRNEFKILKRFLRDCDMLLPNSNAEAEFLEYVLWQARDRIEVVHNGVESHFSAGDADLFRKRYGIEGALVLNVACVDPNKNQLRLIEACSTLPVTLAIIGTRTYYPEYAKECERLASSKVIFIDPLPHEDPLLAGAYAAADVFALPSLIETVGIASLEAGVAGSRVVTSPNGGAREYFGDTAIYPDTTSVESIRHSIESAMKRPHDPKGQSQELLSRFGWDAIGERTLSLYDTCIQHRRIEST